MMILNPEMGKLDGHGRLICPCGARQIALLVVPGSHGCVRVCFLCTRIITADGVVIGNMERKEAEVG